MPDDEVLFGSSVASTTMMSYGSVGGAVAGALAEAMDTHGTPLMAPNSAGSATVSALPSPSAPERPPSPPPPVPEPDTRYEDAEEPAGIAIPGRKSGYSTPQRQLLGASAPPDVIYQMMNSLNQITVSYDPVASLPGTAMLSRSVAPFGMSLPKPNLINHVRFNFNARRTFRRAVDTVKAVNRLQHAVTHESPSISRAASKQGSASDLNGRDGSEDSDETAIRSVSPNIGVLPKPELEKDGSEGTLSNGDMELDS